MSYERTWTCLYFMLSLTSMFGAVRDAGKTVGFILDCRVSLSQGTGN